MNKQFDIIIVGAGLVGASLARALCSQDLRIAIIDAQPLQQQLGQPDGRSLVLSHGSVQVLQSIHAWSALSQHATAIRDIHVSQQGHFGATRLSARQAAVPALGYVTPFEQLMFALQQPLAQQGNLEAFCPAKIQGLAVSAHGSVVQINYQQQQYDLSAKLVIAADGGNSFIRKLQGIDSDVHAYQQHAVVANVTPQLAHQNIAYERFTSKGPMALLPLANNDCALILTVADEYIDEVINASDKDFLKILQQRFGYRLGRMQAVGERNKFPLFKSKAQQITQPGLILIGNAANTMHPIAAQGFNLGLRDAVVLAKLLGDFQANLSSPLLLSEFEKKRQQDQKTTMAFTHGIIQLFAHDLLPLALARSKGMVALDLLSPIKNSFIHRAMGSYGAFPKIVSEIEK